MKQGHMGINIAVPLAKVHALAKLDGGNRTTSVNRAIQLYLDVQGPARNRYGVDADYVRKILLRVVRDIESCTPDELRLTLLRLEATVAGNRGDAERELINEQV